MRGKTKRYRWGILWLIFLFVSNLYAQIQPEVFIQLGHRGGVKAVRFSPDGKYLASASYDNTIKLWDFHTGREVRTFVGHKQAVTSIAFFPDGSYLVSGSTDKMVRVWDVQTGRTIRTWSPYEEEVTCVAVSPDARFIAAGTKDNFVYVWTLDSRSELQRLRGHQSDITAIDFSPDGKYLSSANGGRFMDTKFQIFVWDVETWKIIRTLEGHPKGIDSVRFSPDSAQLVSTSFSSEELKTWDVATGKTLLKTTGQFLDASFSPDGRYIMGVKYGGEVTLWDSLTGRKIVNFDRKQLQVLYLRNVTFSPNSRYIAFGDESEPYLVGAIDLRTGKMIRQFSGDVEPVRQVFFSADEKKVFALMGRGILSWDLSYLPNSRFWDPFDKLGLIEGFALSPKGTYLACTNWGSVFILNQSTGKGERKYEGKGMVSHLRFTPDERFILVARNNQEGTVELWDRSSGKLIRSFPTHYWGMTAFAVSPAGTQIVAGKATLQVFDLSTGKAISKLEGHSKQVHGVAYTPDGAFLVSGGEDLTMRMWDMKTLSLVKTLPGHMGAIRTVQVTPNGKYALSAGEDRTIRIWDLEKGAEVRTLTGHKDTIYSLALSRDGKRILSASHDGTIRLWDFETGKERLQLVLFLNGEWIALTPEGYFDASKNGASYLQVRIGNTLYSMDNFYESFYHPLTVATALSGGEVAQASDMRKGIAPPPEVRILQPASNITLKEDRITVVVHAKDLGGGIGEVRLYHNGKVVGDTARGLQVAARAEEQRLEFTVQLVEGLNTFRAIAFSKEKIESLPAEAQVRYEGSTKEVTLHLLAVGINQYRNEALNLNYAEPDARSIASFFRKEKRLFKETRIGELYNQDATKENILKQLATLQNTAPQDAVIVYLAGHGEVYRDTWYFLPHEVVYPEREEEAKAKGISSAELSEALKKIPAQKVLVLIDTCKAGGALIAFRGYEDRRALQQLSRSTGIHIIAASTKEQYASEVAELQHGVFTYAVLEGLRGKAATSSKTITARSLMAFVETMLPELTRKYYREAQYPVVDSRGMDFPLTVAP